jgi:integrase/recombinase XerD
MENELVKASQASIPAIGIGQGLPAIVQRAGAAAAFVWEEYFKARHTNRHTQRAYLLAVRRFLAWAEGRGCPPLSSVPCSGGRLKGEPCDEIG